LRAAAAILGTALLVYLIVRAGSDKRLENARTIGWGILLVLGLAGVGHIVKTRAWLRREGWIAGLSNLQTAFLRE